MLIKKPADISSSEITPEEVYVNRRKFLAAAGVAAVGLVASQREGRSIIYTAGYEAMRDLLGFLMEDCCAGKPEICAPVVAAASRARATC